MQSKVVDTEKVTVASQTGVDAEALEEVQEVAQEERACHRRKSTNHFRADPKCPAKD